MDTCDGPSDGADVKREDEVESCHRMSRFIT
jgi:hypothetical protein